jgi:hypothetical protein
MPPGALSAITARFEGAPGTVAVAAAILDGGGRPWGWPRPLCVGWPAGRRCLRSSLGLLALRDHWRDDDPHRMCA